LSITSKYSTFLKRTDFSLPASVGWNNPDPATAELLMPYQVPSILVGVWAMEINGTREKPKVNNFIFI